MTIASPYLLFLGDAPDPLAAKVAQGIKDWRPEAAVGQFRMAGCNADMGLPDMTIAEAIEAGAKTMVIGVANRGGLVSEAWIKVLVAALQAGMDVAAGLHNQLNHIPALSDTAAALGRTLHDVRVPNRAYPVANGEKRTGKRLLPVGTDCSCGKMYTALAMEKEMRARGMKADFVATGQTGILVTGDGVPLDAVVCDFISGAIETHAPSVEPERWQLIEGQGSLFHASFAGVTLGLIHGAQPDALVLCHEPTRTHMRGLPGYPIPSLEDLRDRAVQAAQLTNPDVAVIGCAINTAALDEAGAEACLKEIEDRMGLPAVDPFRHGTGRLVDALPA